MLSLMMMLTATIAKCSAKSRLFEFKKQRKNDFDVSSSAAEMPADWPLTHFSCCRCCLLLHSATRPPSTLLLKLVMVLLSSMAMVIGPTPPGTGVIAPAQANASALTSPTVRLPGVEEVVRSGCGMAAHVTRHASYNRLACFLGGVRDAVDADINNDGSWLDPRSLRRGGSHVTCHMSHVTTHLHKLWAANCSDHYVSLPA
jgi:hypothetical protein